MSRKGYSQEQWNWQVRERLEENNRKRASQSALISSKQVASQIVFSNSDKEGLNARELLEQGFSDHNTEGKNSDVGDLEVKLLDIDQEIKNEKNLRQRRTGPFRGF